MSSPISDNTDSTATPPRTSSPPTEEQLKEWRCNLMLTMACRIAIFRVEHPETRQSHVWRTATEVFQTELNGLENAEGFERARVNMEKALDLAKEMAKSGDE